MSAARASESSFWVASGGGAGSRVGMPRCARLRAVSSSVGADDWGISSVGAPATDDSIVLRGASCVGSEPGCTVGTWMVGVPREGNSVVGPGGGRALELGGPAVASSAVRLKGTGLARPRGDSVPAGFAGRGREDRAAVNSDRNSLADFGRASGLELVARR